MRRICWPSLLALALAGPAAAAPPEHVVLEVPSMTCSLCPISVKKALQRVPGVRQASADLATKTAQATYDPDRTSPAALARALSNAGYPAKVRKK